MYSPLGVGGWRASVKHAKTALTVFSQAGVEG